MHGVIFTRVSDAHSLDLRVERENKFIMKKLINKSCESNIKIVAGEQVSSENIYTYFDIFFEKMYTINLFSTNRQTDYYSSNEQLFHQKCLS